MNAKQTKELQTISKVSPPVHQMSDVGGYCYASLTSVALNMLYREEERDSNWNKQFVDKTVKCLTSHLHLPEKVTETALLIARSVEIQHYQPFIDSLKNEAVVVTEGLSIFPKDLVIVGLQGGCYDARLRTLAKFICLMLKVNWSEIEAYEDFVLKSFQEEEHIETEEEKKEKASKEKIRKIKKVALIGAATVGGGVLVGLTGGLAAPFIAAGAGAVIGGAGAAALGSAAGIAIIGSLFGVAGAGLGGYKMNKRVGDVEEFTFEPLTEGSQLHVTIAITGWITEECPDFAFAWRGLANCEEQFVLRYESKYLKQMGSAMDYLVSFAVSQVTSEALKYTVLSSLMAAIIWPATIIAASSVIDNPWSMMTSRTVQAGKMLADVLLSRQQGKRPVTLIGFSLGARVIFYCLQEMSKRKNSEGIIEDAIMLGTPATANPADWKPFRRVVAGKIVNGYCRGDWLLKFLYRTASVQFSIAGLEPIKWTDRRMHNMDLSEIVEGHMDYMNKLDQILDIVGIKTKPRAQGGSKHNLKEWVAVNKERTGISPSTSSSSTGLNPMAECAQEVAEEHTQIPDHTDSVEDALKVETGINPSTSSSSTGVKPMAECSEDPTKTSDHTDSVEDASKMSTDINPSTSSSCRSLKPMAETTKEKEDRSTRILEHTDLVEEDALKVEELVSATRDDDNNMTTKVAATDKVRSDSGNLEDRVGSSDMLVSKTQVLNIGSVDSESVQNVAQGLVSDDFVEVKDKIGREGMLKDNLNDSHTQMKDMAGVTVPVGGENITDVKRKEETGLGQASVSVDNGHQMKTDTSTKERAELLEVATVGHIASLPSSDSGFDSFATQEDINSPEKCVD